MTGGLGSARISPGGALRSFPSASVLGKVGSATKSRRDDRGSHRLTSAGKAEVKQNESRQGRHTVAALLVHQMASRQDHSYPSSHAHHYQSDQPQNLPTP